jgi:hypothetical protein
LLGEKKIEKVAPAFFKMVQDNDEDEWFKMQGWDEDVKHVRFAPFLTICFHVINKRYLEQTSSHLIDKHKSFVVDRMSFGKHVRTR